MNYSENRTDVTKSIINKRKKVIDIEWDKKYLDKKGNIKLDKQVNSNNTSENHNTEEIILTNQQLSEIDQTLRSQQQNANPFVISTDHKEGLNKYLIENIEKLPEQLKPYKKVFEAPPKGKIFDRKDQKLNAILPYDKNSVKKLPMMPHIHLDKQQEDALEREFQELKKQVRFQKLEHLAQVMFLMFQRKTVLLEPYSTLYLPITVFTQIDILFR